VKKEARAAAPRNATQESAIRRSWEMNAAAWTDAVRSGALESRRVATDDAIVRTVLSRRPARVLDAGCGEGWLARRLAVENCDVVGFDGSAPLIERARRDGGAVFHVMSYAEFVHEPKNVGVGFDVVVFNFSLLGRDVAPTLAAARRVVAGDGRLLIQTLHPLSAADGAYVDGWRQESFTSLQGQWAPMPWYYRTIGSWVREIRAAGWQVEQCDEPIDPASGRVLSLIWLAALSDTQR
jgi:SAM-dependent methyltransferase